MEAARKKLVIAIVDDQSAVREAIESLLKSTGYAAKTFSSAEHYLLDGRDAADCLILDVHLPGMSGLELQQELATGTDTRTPVIFITAQEDSDSQLRTRALRLGAVAFLSKPFNDEALLNAVRAACKHGK